MPRPELPVVDSPYYQLPRSRGSGLAVAPTMPFSDVEAVLAATRAIVEPFAGPPPHLLTIPCPPAEIGALAAELATTGVGDLRVVIRLNALPGAALTPATVERLVAAGVATLEIDPEVEPAEHELPEWFELGKACLCYGMPLTWKGSLPPAAVEPWAHLPPARNQAAWQRRWRYGSLGWRRGPGFASVSDSRGEDIRQRRIRLPVLTPIFGEQLDQPAAVPAVPDRTVDALLASGLGAVFGERIVWLPYRLRRWPPDTLLL